MKIKLYSIFVEDQDKALKFYTKTMGFKKKNEIPAGDFKWITLVSPEGPDDLELSLEPNNNPAAKAYQEALFNQGIPITAFASDDIQKEFEALKREGVKFTKEPVMTENPRTAIFNDTCGNLIMMYQV
ncbi:Glyoxalase/Bleomycin resistance protein/Dioxygenase superfamily protein [compost metagenome]